MPTTPANAWLVETERYSGLLRRVFRQNSGEIWLVNNDLRVFSDTGLFRELYLENLVLSPCVDAIRRVFLVLNEDELKKFQDGLMNSSHAIRRNIGSLPVSFRNRIYVSELPEPLKTELKSTPWTFYSLDRDLKTDAASPGVVLVRPPIAPFMESAAALEAGERDPSKRIAVGWILGDGSSETFAMRQRIQKHFDHALKSLTWKRIAGDKVNGFRLDEHAGTGIVPSHERDQSDAIWSPVRSRIDVGVVCALQEEAKTIEASLVGIQDMRKELAA